MVESPPSHDVAASVSETPQSISEVAKALIACGPLLRNPDKSKAGHNYTYTPLERLLEIYNPILSDHGLRIVQLPYDEPQRIGVETLLLHSSGQFIRSRVSFPVAGDGRRSPEQIAGSTITYIRRYAIKSMLGIESDSGVDPDELDSEVSQAVIDRPSLDEEAASLWDHCIAQGSKAKTAKALAGLFEKYANALRTSGIDLPPAKLAGQKSQLFTLYGYEEND